jgi:hypothetical protein
MCTACIIDLFIVVCLIGALGFHYNGSAALAGSRGGSPGYLSPAVGGSSGAGMPPATLAVFRDPAKACGGLSSCGGGSEASAAHAVAPPLSAVGAPVGGGGGGGGPRVKLGSLQAFVRSDDLASDVAPLLFSAFEVHKIVALDIRCDVCTCSCATHALRSNAGRAEGRDGAGGQVGEPSDWVIGNMRREPHTAPAACASGA